MIGFLGAALIVVILLVCFLGSVFFAFLAFLAGKGHPGAAMIVVGLISSVLLFFTLREVMP